MTEEYNRKRWEEVMKKTSSVDAPAGYDLEKKCLLWTGSKGAGGYGLCKYKGKTIGPHRISWMVSYGVDEVPKHEGKTSHVRHLCDVPSCIEPTHLAIGTAADNGRDKHKNPYIRGEFHKCSSITAKVAEQIKKSKDKQSQKQRAKIFGVSLYVIKGIDSGTSWSHIPDVNGVTNREKADKRNAKDNERRASKSITNWTDDQWLKAENKLWHNPDYATRLETTVHGLDIPCLEWKSDSDYPVMAINGLSIRAHLLACIIANKRERPKNLQASHKCNNNKCVERTHLHFQTRSLNILDQHTHGTKKSKLCAEQVLEMRDKYSKGGVTYMQLAKQYSISKRSVSDILNRHYWKHI